MRDELGSTYELNIGTKSYTLKPMTIGTLSDIQNKIVSNKINIISESFPNDRLMVKELTMDIINSKVTDEEIDHFLSTIEGIKYFLSKSLVQEVSDNELNELMTAENLPNIVTVLTNVAGAITKKKSKKK